MTSILLELSPCTVNQPPHPSFQSTLADPNNLMSLVTLMDLAIKRIIRMAMKITPFVNMCQEDQIALLKGGCTELMVLKSVQQYDSEKNSWRVS